VLTAIKLRKLNTKQ